MHPRPSQFGSRLAHAAFQPSVPEAARPTPPTLHAHEPPHPSGTVPNGRGAADSSYVSLNHKSTLPCTGRVWHRTSLVRDGSVFFEARRGAVLQRLTYRRLLVVLFQRSSYRASSGEPPHAARQPAPSARNPATRRLIRMIRGLYPVAQEGMRSGLYFPNRGSIFCSHDSCPSGPRARRNSAGAFRSNDAVAQS